MKEIISFAMLILAGEASLTRETLLAERPTDLVTMVTIARALIQ